MKINKLDVQILKLKKCKRTICLLYALSNDKFVLLFISEKRLTIFVENNI